LNTKIKLPVLLRACCLPHFSSLSVEYYCPCACFYTHITMGNPLTRKGVSTHSPDCAKDQPEVGITASWKPLCISPRCEQNCSVRAGSPGLICSQKANPRYFAEEKKSR
uniref:Uncharacterized protein n=1 Tax=Anas platyrhynchos TaxID=8839 RepID=A0A8B9ZHT7_ANAPL